MTEHATRTIGIIGHGFVGKAVDYGFTRNIQKLVVDPLYTKLTLQDLIAKRPDAAFVAVPTPSLADGRVQDKILFEVITEFAKADSDILLIVKSTAPPTTFTELVSIYPKLVYNPEFLTEKNSLEDFVNPPMHILGGDPRHADLVEKLYKEHSDCAPCPVYKTDIKSASLAKYTINTFLATKVVFFNQLKDIHTKTGATSDWEEFIKIISADKRIGGSHMRVPGFDGIPGFGGSCFPKDTKGFAYYANEVSAKFELLEKAVSLNNAYREKPNSDKEKTGSSDPTGY